ncbi:MAG: hypothetical protein J7L37_04935 [Thermococcus sp.]|nr:hypothetical protein [Thermococcus sp.]
MRTDELKRVLISQREEMEEFIGRERIIPREVEENVRGLLSSPRVLTILGVRRSGKSVLAWRLSGENSLYINFFR